MDTRTAELLLEKIRTEKQGAENSPSWLNPLALLNKVPAIPIPQPSSYPKYDTLADDLHAQANSKLQQSAVSDILRTALLAGGAGAAMRGISGLSRMFSGNQQPVPSRTVDMPVMYPRNKEEEEEKTARDSDATSKFGLKYYIPGMVLGAPLAAYGGWAGVDAILDKQRRKKTEADLEAARQEYRNSLLGAYKQGSEVDDSLAVLDSVFDENYAKQAADTEQPGFFTNLIKKYAPNLPGAATGLAATYAIPAGIGGYALVDSIMKKRSKRTLLEQAMRERARRQAMQQPAELYAIPTPQDDDPVRQ
jgi:hypothetical protein